MDARELRTTLTQHVEGSRAVSELQREIEGAGARLAEKDRAATRRLARSLDRLRARSRQLETQRVALDEEERALAMLERQARALARLRDAAARRLEAYQRELERAALGAELDLHGLAVGMDVLARAEAPVARTLADESARRAWALLAAALVPIGVALLFDAAEGRAPVPPEVWVTPLDALGPGVSRTASSGVE